MKGDTYKVLKIPGSGVRYLDPDWARDFTLLNLSFLISEMWRIPLTSVAQLVGCCSAKRKATSSIPGQGTCLGCGFGPWWGHVRGSQSMFLLHIDVFSLSLFLPPSLS